MSDSGNKRPHVLVFPYPAPGHIIPLLDLTQLLLSSGLTVTVIVTPEFVSLLDPLLSSHPSSSIQPLVLSLPKAPASLVPSLRATGELYDPILQWFKSHPSPPVAIVSDFFLGWTEKLGKELGVPRLVFWASCALSSLISSSIWRDRPKVDDPADENFLLSFPEIPNSPKYPLWQMSTLFRMFKEGDPDWEFIREGMVANTVSWGVVFNSFTELEGVYIDHTKKEMGHDRVWAVGPLLPLDGGPTSRGGSSAVAPHKVTVWLDDKPDDSVVYICFGSRMELTTAQRDALAAALESSGVHFIWIVKAGIDDGDPIPKGFEDRVAGKGLIIRGWAPQVPILMHRATGAFVTHCGWNSVLEGISAGVMMLTWPMGADQFYNANLLVDELHVAARACEGGDEKVPDSSELARLLAESVSGKRLERSRVVQLRDAAVEAVRGGSSSKDIDDLVKELGELGCGKA